MKRTNYTFTIISSTLVVFLVIYGLLVGISFAQKYISNRNNPNGSDSSVSSDTLEVLPEGICPDSYDRRLDTGEFVYIYNDTKYKADTNIFIWINDFCGLEVSPTI